MVTSLPCVMFMATKGMSAPSVSTECIYVFIKAKKTRFNNEFFLVYYYDKLSYLYYYIVILHLLLWVNRVAIKEDLVEAEKQRNMESVVI